VPLIPGAIHYRHDSRLAVRLLAEQLREVPDMCVTTFAALIMDKGVMVPQQWWVRLPLWIAVRRGMSRFDFWKVFYDHQPKFALDLLEATARHAIDGVDREQPNSVGGFSQREINFLANTIAIVTGEFSAELARTSERNTVN
jgi:hypothetical protein